MIGVADLAVHAVLDRDGDKLDLSDIQPNIAGYYTVDGALQSMPFNTSMPLFYFNRTAFTQAGLDPNNPPRTLADIRAAAEKIKANPAPGVQFPFGASLYGWFLEQFTAQAGQNLCEPANGHSGRASSVTLASDTNVALLSWWQGMVRDGLAMKLDSNTDNGDNAFTSGVAAMSLESTAWDEPSSKVTGSVPPQVSSRKQPRWSTRGPDTVPEANRSPGRTVAPLTVRCASCWAHDQFISA